MIECFGVGAHAACALVANGQEPRGKFVLLQSGQTLTHSRRHRLSLGFSGDRSDSLDCLMDRVVFYVQSHWYLSTKHMVPVTGAHGFSIGGSHQVTRAAEA